MPRFRQRPLNRRLNRPLARRCTRRLTRRIGRGPRVNHLGHALRAFGKAIRARRQLLRLAPEVFDRAVVQRLATERHRRQQVQAQCQSALDKVYGPTEPHPAETADRCNNGAETVQFSRRKRHRIESTLLEYELWMAAGREAFACHQHWQPHRRLSLATAARLVDVASLFGRLACGLELQPAMPPKDPEPPCTEAISFEDALERVYGNRTESGCCADGETAGTAESRGADNAGRIVRTALRRESP